MYIDEAGYEYNAMLIAEKGTDEYGKSFPLYFKSVGDYKSPFYIYTAAVLYKILGNSPYIFRFTSFLFYLMFLCFFLKTIQLLFPKNKIILYTSFITAGFFPWYFTLSRISFDVISQVGIYSVIIYLTIRALKVKKSTRLYFFIGLLLGLSSLTYTSGRIHIFFMIGMFFLLWWKSKVQKKQFVMWLSGLLVIIIPLVIYFSYNPDVFISRYRIEMGKEQIGLSIKFIRSIAQNYLSHYSPNYLLLIGDANLRHSTGFSGQIQIGLFVIFLIGLYRILRERKSLWLFLLGIILIAPIPATIVPNAPHALRSAIMGFPILLIGMYGIDFLSRQHKNILIALILIIIISQNIFFTYRYFTRYASFTPLAFETYGLNETLIKAQEMGGKTAYLTDISLTTYLFQRKNNMIPSLTMNVEEFRKEKNRLNEKGACLVYTKSIYLDPQLYIDRGFSHYTEPDYATGVVCKLN